MMAFYFIDSVLKQSQMLADRRDPKGVMFTGLVDHRGSVVPKNKVNDLLNLFILTFSHIQ